MNEPDTSGQARKGLLDTVKGKAKEVAGAVAGNDALTAQGQLDQEQARLRREADVTDTVAREKAADAAEELGQVREAAADARAAVGHRAAAAEEHARDVQRREHRAAQQHTWQRVGEETHRADTAARVEAARAEADARTRITAAAQDRAEATAEHRRAVEHAEQVRARAERERRTAEDLGGDAGLS